MIDLNRLNYEDKILIDENINYDDNYLKNTDILSLDNVKVVGEIYIDYEENIIFKFKVNGSMELSDAITLENVDYDFSIEEEQILEKSTKTLDLIEFLWHYIVLEIPIRYTTGDINELKKTYQDIYDEDYSNTNPFKDFFGE